MAMGIVRIEMTERTRQEFEALMKQLSEIQSRLIEEFCTKVYKLNVGEELYQPFLSCLPAVQELRRMLNEKTSTKQFEVHENINGITVIRLS